MQEPSYVGKISMVSILCEDGIGPNRSLGVEVYHRLVITGRSLHCQVEHHVRIKFATPVLHGIDNFKIYDVFSTYT